MNWINQIYIRVQQWKLKAYLMHTLHYSQHEAIHTIEQLRKMTPESLHQFLQWFTKDVVPQAPANGVLFMDIVNGCQMDYVAAFLAFDWVKTDPVDAKYALWKPQAELDVSQDTKQSLLEIATKRGWELSMPPVIENTDDLVSPIPESNS